MKINTHANEHSSKGSGWDLDVEVFEIWPSEFVNVNSIINFIVK